MRHGLTARHPKERKKSRRKKKEYGCFEIEMIAFFGFVLNLLALQLDGSLKYSLRARQNVE
jgi:hypothetical protein